MKFKTILKLSLISFFSVNLIAGEMTSSRPRIRVRENKNVKVQGNVKPLETSLPQRTPTLDEIFDDLFSSSKENADARVIVNAQISPYVSKVLKGDDQSCSESLAPEDFKQMQYDQYVVNSFLELYNIPDSENQSLAESDMYLNILLQKVRAPIEAIADNTGYSGNPTFLNGLSQSDLIVANFSQNSQQVRNINLLVTSHQSLELSPYSIDGYIEKALAEYKQCLNSFVGFGVVTRYEDNGLKSYHSSAEIKKLYIDNGFHDADPAGLEFWRKSSGSLSSIDKEFKAIRSSFESKIKTLYAKYKLPVPDKALLDRWIISGATDESNLEQTISSISKDGERKKYHSVSEIEALYRANGFHVADPAGLKYWMENSDSLSAIDKSFKTIRTQIENKIKASYSRAGMPVPNKDVLNQWIKSGATTEAEIHKGVDYLDTIFHSIDHSNQNAIANCSDSNKLWGQWFQNQGFGLVSPLVTDKMRTTGTATAKEDFDISLSRKANTSKDLVKNMFELINIYGGANFDYVSYLKGGELNSNQGLNGGGILAPGSTTKGVNAPGKVMSGLMLKLANQRLVAYYKYQKCRMLKQNQATIDLYAAYGDGSTGTSHTTTTSSTPSCLKVCNESDSECKAGTLVTSGPRPLALCPATATSQTPPSGLYNFVHGGGQAECNKSVLDRFPGSQTRCTKGGGCGVSCGMPSSSCPSANPQHFGACVDPAQVATVSTVMPKPWEPEISDDTLMVNPNNVTPDPKGQYIGAIGYRGTNSAGGTTATKPNYTRDEALAACNRTYQSYQRDHNQDAYAFCKWNDQVIFETGTVPAEAKNIKVANPETPTPTPATPTISPAVNPGPKGQYIGVIGYRGLRGGGESTGANPSYTRGEALAACNSKYASYQQEYNQDAFAYCKWNTEVIFEAGKVPADLKKIKVTSSATTTPTSATLSCPGGSDTLPATIAGRSACSCTWGAIPAGSSTSGVCSGGGNLQGTCSSLGKWKNIVANCPGVPAAVGAPVVTTTKTPTTAPVSSPVIALSCPGGSDSLPATIAGRSACKCTWGTTPAGSSTSGVCNGGGNLQGTCSSLGEWKNVVGSCPGVVSN